MYLSRSSNISPAIVIYFFSGKFGGLKTSSNVVLDCPAGFGTPIRISSIIPIVLICSSNVSVSVFLMKQLGDTEPVRALLHNMGIDSSERRFDGEYVVPKQPSISLGASDLSVMEMTGAYLTFANNGVFKRPHYILSIEDGNGRVIYSHVEEENVVLSSDANYVMVDLLKKEVGNIIKHPHSDTNNSDYAISRSMKNLISDGLVECFQSESQPYFRLSTLGKKKLNSNALVDDTALISNNWDGYWRIIIIDLPEERKNEREALRYLLKKAGFVCLKNSVWISMYPYENLFINIKKDLNLTSEMMIVVADKIDEETQKEFLNSIKN